MLQVQLVKFSAHAETIRAIRQRVFTEEQGVDPAIDFDGLDGTAFQAIAFSNSQPAGTGRMLPDGHIGRIAVLPEFRKLGTGTQIMTALINHARQQNIPRVFLGAQITAEAFYTRLGFQPCGNNYVEADILHVPMDLDLAGTGHDTA